MRQPTIRRENTSVTNAVYAIPNQLGIVYCVHTLESFAKYVAPELGWKPNTEGPVDGYAI